MWAQGVETDTLRLHRFSSKELMKTILCRIGIHGRRVGVVGVRRFDRIEIGYEGERWSFSYVKTSGNCVRCGKTIIRDLYQLHPDFDKYATQVDQRKKN